MEIESFVIAERYCGPPRSGNGGYVCGRLARHVAGPAAVRLKAPPPLKVPLRVDRVDDRACLLHGEALVAEARPAPLHLQVPASPSLAQAAQSAAGYPGFKAHAFPGCFVCGPNRMAGDGLRIFPGPLPGSSMLAAPWTPDASLSDGQGHVKPEFLWSALDCTGGFAVLPVPEGFAIVLGELTASVESELACGEPCIVIGWPMGTEGRKRLAGSALYTSSGRLVAKARAVWLEVPASAWN